MMIQHAEYTMLMSLVLDGEACADEEVRLREHLRTCEDCRQTWQRWRELDRRLMAAPVIAVPVDFSALVLARIDSRVAEERRRQWFIAGLAAAWVGAVVIALLGLVVVNGWHLQLAPEQGPLAAAWAGVSSATGWAFSEVVAFFGEVGAPAIAAATGALLCLTCALAMMWLWVVARVGAGSPALLAAE
jgi:anti-sigma factor RsiW